MDRMRLILSRFGIMLTLLAGLSLAAAGGAHRIPTADDAEAALTQTYGQVADVCGEVGGKPVAMQDCPVCHLVAAVVLPEAVQSPKAVDLRFAAEFVLPQTQRAADTPFDPAHGMRAPPLV